MSRFVVVLLVIFITALPTSLLMPMQSAHASRLGHKMTPVERVAGNARLTEESSERLLQAKPSQGRSLLVKGSTRAIAPHFQVSVWHQLRSTAQRARQLLWMMTKQLHALLLKGSLIAVQEGQLAQPQDEENLEFDTSVSIH